MRKNNDNFYANNSCGIPANWTIWYFRITGHHLIFSEPGRQWTSSSCALAMGKCIRNVHAEQIRNYALDWRWLMNDDSIRYNSVRCIAASRFVHNIQIWCIPCNTKQTYHPRSRYTANKPASTKTYRWQNSQNWPARFGRVARGAAHRISGNRGRCDPILREGPRSVHRRSPRREESVAED